MSRPYRIQYANAYYHVMSRGRGRCRMFHSRIYFEAFLDTLEQATQRFNVQVHAYCLMPNHYHLLVKTPDANLDRAMRHINGVYVQRHNMYKRTDGPLLRGRYKAILVDHDSYYVALTRYIHRNPIDARRPLVKRLEDYPWSSYPACIGLVDAPEWLYSNELLSAFGMKHGNTSYKHYMRGASNDDIVSHYEKARIAPVLGGDEFKKWVKDSHMSAGVTTVEQACDSTRLSRPTIDDVVGCVADYFQLDLDSVTTSEPRTKNVPRWIAMYLCQEQGGHALKHIAQAFGVNHYSAVTKLITKLRRQMKGDPLLTEDVDHLKKLIEL